MRSERIKIKDESLASRTRLYNFLRSVNEPIYKLTSLLDITQYYSIFEYHAGYWGSSGGSATMSINDFIAKYSPKTKPKIKSDGYWYGVDALELVPIEQKTSTKKPPKSKPTTTTTIAKNEESVAQPEPIKSIKKEETFMSRLKEVTKQTGTQNIEAAKIAAKMEAGRIINKQVIKQAKPHVPMLLRGYLDTPLAPVILANAVAMLGNHTGNAKVQKVSELMLLAAADVTVQSFNLDKIINDVLSGIKLPAGILDDEE